MNESAAQRVAFNVYWYLGPARSLEAVAQTIAARPRDFGFRRPPHVRTLYRWSSRFHWQDRLEEMEAEARRLERQAQVDEMRQMNERHAREALAVQQKAIERLRSLGPEEMSPEAAVRSLVEAIKLERLVRGAATERTDHTGGVAIGQVDLTRFSDQELETFIRGASARGQSGAG